MGSAALIFTALCSLNITMCFEALDCAWQRAAVYLRSLKSSSSIELKTFEIVAFPSISSRETLSERNNMASRTLAQSPRGDDEQQPNTQNLLRAESVLVKLSERQRLSRYSGVDFSPSKSISKFFFLFRFV